MNTNIESTKQAFFKELEQSKSIDELLRFKGAYLGKQGQISSLLAQIKEVKPEKRGEFGQAVNQLKKEATAAFQKKKAELEQVKSNIDKVYVYGKYIRHTFNKIKTQKKEYLAFPEAIIKIYRNN